jgi:hypothetical protein
MKGIGPASDFTIKWSYTVTVTVTVTEKVVESRNERDWSSLRLYHKMVVYSNSNSNSIEEEITHRIKKRNRA